MSNKKNAESKHSQKYEHSLKEKAPNGAFIHFTNLYNIISVYFASLLSVTF